ncbi:mucin-4, partial [Uranotaenia lowii]|uniref:mucin-4 n=1 Tax=Uranotaenia lowii TaxID=190385 RepID=UPI00247AC17A
NNSCPLLPFHSNPADGSSCSNVSSPSNTIQSNGSGSKSAAASVPGSGSGASCNGHESLTPSASSSGAGTSQQPPLVSALLAEAIASRSSPASSSRARRYDQKKSRRKSPKGDTSANVTIIEVSNETGPSSTPAKPGGSPKLNSQRGTSKVDLATGKLANSTLITDDSGDENYKSNVQIIPSNVEYDNHRHHHHLHHHLQDQEPSIIASINDRQITTVKVPNLVSGITEGPSGNVILSTSPPVHTGLATVIASVATSSTQIKSDNSFGTVTQIAVNSCDRPRTPPQHYEQVFLLPSPIQVISSNSEQSTVSLQSAPVSIGRTAASKLNKSKVMLLSKQQRSSSHSEIQINRIKNLRNDPGNNKENQGESSGSSSNQPAPKNGILPSASSPAIPSNSLSPSKRAAVDKNIYTPQPQRPMLQRGLTEMVISRSTNAVAGSHAARCRQPSNPVVAQVNDKLRNEVNEQRRRSSSTSDAHPETSGNPVMRARLNGASRLQSPPQPFRPHHQLINQLDPLNGSNRKMTLREQQVMQLRREMMHPGGVRLQLRRKDCINSIGLVDAFGAVWVAGWKQKEHPVLYNALHIGDQLISVAGVAITSASEAHKTIRGAPGLFVELIIRRVPFGRVYAIRREMDGQCLGLIRDGNTATIVDVVPNSLTARHGLPPKAQSCDGLSLTFWVLTEINGRPLNLFFKDNEIRDRLNAVGRDISILVQPADLVTKLKKQLKSLRGHKDFIVQ